MGGAFCGGPVELQPIALNGHVYPFLCYSSTRKVKIRNGGRKRRLRRRVSSSLRAPYSGPPKTDTDEVNKKADRS